MKTCSKCRETKPFEDFGRNRAQPDGWQNQCKTCRLPYGRTDKARAYTRAYQRTESGKAAMKRAGTKYRATDRGRAKQLESALASRGRYPKRWAARDAVNNAVKRGALPKVKTLACKECGKPATQYHHTRGYEPEHWLDVSPICRACHESHHPKPRKYAE